MNPNWNSGSSGSVFPGSLQYSIDHMHCIESICKIPAHYLTAVPVDHEFVSGLMTYEHRQSVLIDILRIQLAELRVHVRRLSGRPAMISILIPQRVESDVVFEKFLMYPFIVRYDLNWDKFLRGKE